MKKKYSLYVALASVMLATSCSNEQDVMGGRISNRSILFNPTVPHATSSRAVETTIDNLDAFKVTAFLPGADNYMENVAYTKADGAWSTNDGNFFWPTSSEYLNFYAYAPADPCKMATSEDADGASFSIDHQFQKLENFSPNAAAAEQKDFIYAYAKGNLEENGTDGVDIKFKHALSQITVAAKNDNKAYTVKVSGVKIGNVMSKSSFSFPSTGGDGNDASWSQDSQTGEYTTSLSEAVTLGSDATDFKDQGNVPFMLIPQSLTSTNKASEGAYIALKVSIAMQGGKVLCSDKWAYVGIGGSWQMGKHYTYTVDFSDGAGQDETGKQLISGKEMVLNVKVSPWNEKGIAPLEKVITGTATRTFTYKVGGRNGTQYRITPDASGNWSIPVSKFNGGKNTSDMFYNCGELTSIDLSGWNTSNVTDMNYMFYACSSLTFLDLSGWNTSNVTNMNSMFGNCKNLTTLDVSHFNTSNVTIMWNMFCSCSSLTSLDLSGWNTSNVTIMDNMFGGCSSLTTLDLSGWNTSLVTNMESMFSGCSSLTTLDLSHFNTSNVTTMQHMFSGCSSLTTLDLSHFNTSNVTDMGVMFYGCSSLKTIRMVGCSSATVDKIKAQLATDGITSCTIETE